LPEAQLAKLVLPDILLAAIHEAHRLKTHESQRRHLQYIGKIMREIDPEPIQIMLRNLQFHHDQRTAQLHQIEQWRDQLIAGDEAFLQTFLQDHPGVDRQQLRQWVRKAKNDLKNQKNTGGETGLFRFLREME
jgi:ribosome-associated protein